VLGDPCTPGSSSACNQPANPCAAGYIWSCSNSNGTWLKESIACYTDSTNQAVTTAACATGEVLYVNDVAGTPCAPTIDAGVCMDGAYLYPRSAATTFPPRPTVFRFPRDAQRGLAALARMPSAPPFATPPRATRASSAQRPPRAWSTAIAASCSPHPTAAPASCLVRDASWRSRRLATHRSRSKRRSPAEEGPSR
jgi:hypothetical protein